MRDYEGFCSGRGSGENPAETFRDPRGGLSGRSGRNTGLPNSPTPDSEPSDGPKVTVTCDIESTIAQIDSHVEDLRREFQYDEASPFDKLLIEQILVAWVQWYVAGWLLDGQLTQKRSWLENQYFTQRYQQCQSRLTRAIDQLAKLRLISPHKLRLETRAERAAKERRWREICSATSLNS